MSCFMSNKNRTHYSLKTPAGLRKLMPSSHEISDTNPLSQGPDCQQTSGNITAAKSVMRLKSIQLIKKGAILCLLASGFTTHPALAKNDSPISKHSFLSEIFRKVLANQATGALESLNDKFQSGFWKQHGNSFSNDILMSSNEGD